MRSDQRRQRGFTMIEVVVALAVVTIVLASIASLFGSVSNGARTIEQRITLIETARLIASGLLHGVDIPGDGLAGETLGHRWQVRLSPFGEVDPVPESPWTPQNVVVRIRSPSGATLDLETVRLQKRVGP